MPPFTELGLSEPLTEALKHLGYENPTPIQEQAIPALLAGSDVIGQAQTGTGKTAAFGLPLLQYVDPSMSEVQALVLTPTRELCIQVTQALRAYGATRPTRCSTWASSRTSRRSSRAAPPAARPPSSRPRCRRRSSSAPRRGCT